MPSKVALWQLENLAHKESKNELLLEIKENTELHIISMVDKTVIKLPFGNKFDIIDGRIIIHEKKLK